MPAHTRATPFKMVIVQVDRRNQTKATEPNQWRAEAAVHGDDDARPWSPVIPGIG